VWHVDLYRLDGVAEADALALEEGGHALTLIEWPERLGGRLDPRALHLTIEGAGTPARRLTAHVPPAWEGRWPHT
jgi:tRNA threonylcarbamoyladenosine biosynthesis protein TsaE